MRELEGEWFDLGLRSVIRGVIYAYEISDEKSGKWLLNVRISEETGKAAVTAETSERTTWLHDQIKKKTDTFQTSVDGQKYFHPLGIGYVERGRFHYMRPDKLNDVPQEIREKFNLTKYEHVSPIRTSKTFNGKIVVVMEKDKPDEMALLFFMEKIRPVFK